VELAVGLALWIALLVIVAAEQRVARGLPPRPGWRGNTDLRVAAIFGFGAGMTCLSTGLDAWRTGQDPVGVIVLLVGVALVVAGFAIWLEALIAARRTRRTLRA
jgi:hypothetical protein